MLKVSLTIASIVLAFAVNAAAQSCPGSHLTYVLRDPKGKIIKDPGGWGYSFAGATPEETQRWRTSIEGEFAEDADNLPADVKAVAATTKGIAMSQFCNFRDKRVLKVNHEGKTMELTFNFPWMNSQESADWVVDSLPFKAGKYSITLAKPVGKARYSGANGWKVSK